MKHKLFILFAISQFLCLSGMAQNHLKIKTIFDQYGKAEGSTLVQLSTDVLSQGSRITFYKSLITNENKDKIDVILRAVEDDIKNGIKISELKKNGKIESGTYHIKNGGSSKENEYILYKNKSNKISIVYLKGNFNSSELDSELKNLKNLIIYVNNKQIKLQ